MFPRIPYFVLLMTFALSLATTKEARAADLVNGSFESVSASSYEFGQYNTRLGTWGLDLASSVTAEQGIVPLDGTRMLKFLATNLTYSVNGLSGDVAQLVSAQPNQVFSATAFFNRIASPGTDSGMAVLLRAYSGSIAGFSSASVLRESITRITTDSNLATWESATSSLIAPSGTTYVAVLLIAFDSPDNLPPNEFLGNYADLVTISVVPEPSVLTLSLLGAILLASRIRKGIESSKAASEA